MDNLGLYALSVILSFLNESEGTRFLLTHRRFTKRILPLFRVRNAIQICYVRYKFVVAPVQDSTVLLERLNTRRLYRRHRRPSPNNSTWELANMEWINALSNEKNACQEMQFLPPKLELLRFYKSPSIAKDSVAALIADDQMWESGVTLLASYPRSGNTLLRTLLERVTGLVTGSDTRPDRPLSQALSLQYDLVGEGITSSAMVKVVKTHWPERRGCAIVDAQRVILLVRNPYDVIDSYWNMNATNTHNQTVTDEVYDRFQSFFEELVRNEMHIWKRFIEYWAGQLNNVSSTRVPILLVRFEDLILDPAVQMNRIMQFLLRKPLSEFWLQRIQHVTRGPLANLGSYHPRSTAETDKSGTDNDSGSHHDAAASIGKSLRKKRYSEGLLREMHLIAGTSLLQRFGYDIFDQNFPDNFPCASSPQLPSIWSVVQSLTVASAPASVQKSLKRSVIINQGDEIRPLECPYGRAMRQWRWSYTDQDRNPFPTMRRPSVARK